MSQDINVGFLSEAINNKADIDLRNIDTNKCDMVIEYQEPTSENDYKWYRLYASGWVEQGGYANINGSGVQTITLPIVMQNNQYVVVKDIKSGTVNNTTTVVAFVSDLFGTKNKTTSSFQTHVYNNYGITEFYWQVSGMADMTHHEILPNPTSNTARALVIQVLEGMYPVGSLYMGTQATCPMSVFFGTWELVSNGKALWTGDGTNANTIISAGLPDIQATWICDNRDGSTYHEASTGAVTQSYKSQSWSFNGGAAYSSSYKNTLKASKSNEIYGNSDTVQPPAYVVNVWRRTA